MKSRNWNWLAVLVMLALIGSACAPPAPQATEAAGGGTIVVGLQAEPVTLDAQQMSDYNSTRAGRHIFDALLHFKDESTELEPALAERWDISDDGLSYTRLGPLGAVPLTILVAHEVHSIKDALVALVIPKPAGIHEQPRIARIGGERVLGRVRDGSDAAVRPQPRRVAA